jgi:CubicO group peptidase (beta-lactamase class C family)
MMKKFILLPLLILLAQPYIFAQPSAKTFKEIDAFIEKARTDWQVPGVGVAIVQGNKVLYAKGFGPADLESGRIVDDNTLFAIGSSTKAMTALSVLQLVDDDLVELDKPVREYLPDFRMYNDYLTNHLTVRDLLTHRSGLPRHDVVWYGAADSRKELFGKLQYLEPTAGLREKFQYQNLMYMTAGYLVGELRNRTWEGVVKEHIFAPLGMSRANFSVTEMAADPNHAKPYRLEKDVVKPYEFRNIDAMGPAGSVNASANEMSAWLIAQLQGGKFGENQLASPELIQESHQSQMWLEGGGPYSTYDNGGGPSTYGLGWFITTHKGHKMVEHGGNIDGFSAMVAMLPKDSIGIVVLTNMNGTILPALIRNYVFDKMLDEKPRDWNGEFLELRKTMMAQQEKEKDEEDLKQVKGTTPSHPMSDYAGEFFHPAYGTINVNTEGDSLHFSYHAASFTLGHYHYDVFSADHPVFGNMKVAFHTNIDGEIDRLSTSLEAAVDPLEFKRQPKEMSFTDEELSAFTGEYLVMGTQKIEVSKDDDGLKMTVPGQPVYSLVFHKGMEFKLEGLDGFSVLFQKDDSGNISDLVLLQPNGQFKGERVTAE